MVQERGSDGAPANFFEVFEFGIGFGGAHLFSYVQPRQGADPIHAVRKTQRQIIGGFQVRRFLNRFANKLKILLGIELIGNDAAAAIDKAKLSAMMLPCPLGVDQSHEKRREIAENLN